MMFIYLFIFIYIYIITANAARERTGRQVSVHTGMSVLVHTIQNEIYIETSYYSSCIRISSAYQHATTTLWIANLGFY